MNWGQIKAAVAGYANRTDLSAMMPTFLDLAEQRIYNGAAEGDVPPLRLSTMLTTATYAGALPADFLEMKRVSAIMSTTYKKPLDFKPVEAMATQETASVGLPAFYSLQNNALTFAPPFSQSAEIIYYARFGALSADSDTNWLTQNASTAYISAMLIEVGYYLRDNDLAKRELDRFASQINAIQSQDDGNKHSGAQLRMIQDARRLV